MGRLDPVPPAPIGRTVLKVSHEEVRHWSAMPVRCVDAPCLRRFPPCACSPVLKELAEVEGEFHNPFQRAELAQPQASCWPRPHRRRAERYCCG